MHERYDICLYNGEADMLDLRFAELQLRVNFFVIIEAEFTFSGQRRELQYPKQIDNFKHKPSKRVIYKPIQFSELPPGIKSAWDREAFQRNYANDFITKLPPDSIVMLSDVDEIPDLTLIKNWENPQLPVTFNMCFHYYHLRWRKSFRWRGTVMFWASQLKNLTLQNIRDQRNWYALIDSGWHLSYFMTPEEISAKIRSFSHQEYNTPELTDPERIKQKIERGADLFDRPGEMLVENMLIEHEGKWDKYWPHNFKVLPERYWRTNKVR